jgi:hypothetical protein
VTFPDLSAFAQSVGLPSFVFNATVVPPRRDDELPLSERIFELGSMGYGSDSCGYLAWNDTEGFGWEPGAQVEKGWFWKQFKTERNGPEVVSPYATIRNVNVAPAISGAAVDAANIELSRRRWFVRLLNVGLEYVVPSPMNERRIVRLSDGGHSENLGLYSLLRRQCRNILIVDAEYDPSFRFGSFQKVKVKAERELGVRVDVPCIDSIANGACSFCGHIPVMEGTITADGRPHGRVFYIKLSMHQGLLRDQADAVNVYAETNSAFPQESTVNQYFGPERFNAYRALGYAIARTLDIDIRSETSLGVRAAG